MEACKSYDSPQQLLRATEERRRELGMENLKVKGKEKEGERGTREKKGKGREEEEEEEEEKEKEKEEGKEEGKRSKMISQPSLLKNVTMRDYQLEGLSWILSLFHSVPFFTFSSLSVTCFIPFQISLC